MREESATCDIEPFKESLSLVCKNWKFTLLWSLTLILIMTAIKSFATSLLAIPLMVLHLNSTIAYLAHKLRQSNTPVLLLTEVYREFLPTGLGLSLGQAFLVSLFYVIAFVTTLSFQLVGSLVDLIKEHNLRHGFLLGIIMAVLLRLILILIVIYLTPFYFSRILSETKPGFLRAFSKTISLTWLSSFRIIFKSVYLRLGILWMMALSLSFMALQIFGFFKVIIPTLIVKTLYILLKTLLIYWLVCFLAITVVELNESYYANNYAGDKASEQDSSHT
jgi:hypothetical protein